jgi:ornithine cyclodeaminase
VQGTLQALCRGKAAGRQGADEITLFKSVGTALADLAAAEQVMASPDNRPVVY